MIESPIRISVGAPERSSPSAPKTVRKNPVKPATSLVNIRGNTDGQPIGLDWLMSHL